MGIPAATKPCIIVNNFLRTSGIDPKISTNLEPLKHKERERDKTTKRAGDNEH